MSIDPRSIFIGKNFRIRHPHKTVYGPNRADQSARVSMDDIVRKFRTTNVRPIGNAGAFSYDLSEDLSKLDLADLQVRERDLSKRLSDSEANVKAIKSKLTTAQAKPATKVGDVVPPATAGGSGSAT